MSSSQPVLSISHLSVNFGGLKALSDVNLELRRGEVVGLIGPNGAGKTTVFNALCGIVKPAEGSLSLYGELVKWPKPHQLVDHKLSRTLQGVGLFGELTVLENVMLAAQHKSKVSLLSASFGLDNDDEEFLRTKSLQTLESVYAGDLAHRRADTLAYPDAKRVAIARALVNDPKILLLDEPAGGLGNRDIIWMNDLIRNIKKKMSVLIVEHHMDVVMTVCDRIFVLNFGEIIASGDAESVRKDPAVIAAYLGASEL